VLRDKISAQLQENGFIAQGKKIGRSTATYYLRELKMTLVCPRKGIYKDGHERADTVEERKKYTAFIHGLRAHERTYVGDNLEIEILPADNTMREVVRVYHDESIYASHEGTMQVWVNDKSQATYKKPRGHVVMASGFICRYVSSLNSTYTHGSSSTYVSV
jgi:hypothetical protein